MSKRYKIFLLIFNTLSSIQFQNLTHLSRANSSQTTGEWLASVVASWGLGMLALRGDRFVCVCVGGGGGGGLIQIELESGKWECWERVGNWGRVELLRLRTALPTMELSPSNSFGESHSWIVKLRALWDFNALRALPNYSNFEDEKSNGSTKKLVKR